MQYRLYIYGKYEIKNKATTKDVEELLTKMDYYVLEEDIKCDVILNNGSYDLPVYSRFNTQEDYLVFKEKIVKANKLAAYLKKTGIRLDYLCMVNHYNNCGNCIYKKLCSELNECDKQIEDSEANVSDLLEYKGKIKKLS